MRSRLVQHIARLDWRAVLMILVTVLGIAVLGALIANQQLAFAARDRALRDQSHSYEVMILAQHLGRNMAAAEATLGRYVVSAETAVGRDYADEWQNAASRLDLLARRTRDNPAQLALTTQFKSAFADRSKELAQIAYNTGAGRHQAAYAFFNAARRSPALVQIDRLLAQIFDTERMLLAQRKSQTRVAAERAASDTRNLILFGVLLAAGAIMLGWLNIRAIRDRAAVAADAAAQRQRTLQLEAAVTAATAGLQEEARERATAEAQLRQAQKMEAVGQLTGGIAHDFNNMLAVVLGGLELAKRHLPDGADRSAKHIDNASEGAGRAAALTRQLLAFARAEPLSPQAIDPVELIAGMSDLFERTLGEGITVATRVDVAGWHVWADRHQLENALLNLAVNARDAMDGRGTLTIVTGHAAFAGEASDACAPGNYVTLAVADTGVGMSEDLKDRVFEPFFTTKPVGKGTGLGLSQIFGFVRQSGGEIRIDTAPGNGTTVTLLLPCHAADKAVADTGSLPIGRDDIAPSATLDILLVEDDPRVLSATMAALQELGHRPVACNDPLTAPRIIAGMDSLDLILTDVVMPGQTGPELIAALKPQLQGVAVLFVTGYAGDAADHDRFEGCPVLRKPFTLAALEASIAEAIGRQKNAAP